MQDTNTAKYSREAQEAIYAQWKVSDQSQAAFCREQNIPYNKFSYWHKREEKKKLKNSPAFAHVNMGAHVVRNNTPVGRLILANGIRVDVFSEPTLIALINKLALAI